MTISCVAHAAALFFGFMAISAQPMEAPPVQTLPVSFVSEKDFSQLTQGVKNAPQLKIPDIKPLADKVDATKIGGSACAESGRQTRGHNRDGQADR